MEAERRDPDHLRPWLALVDGNRHQIDRIKAEAKERGIDITIVCDWIHVVQEKGTYCTISAGFSPARCGSSK